MTPALGGLTSGCSARVQEARARQSERDLEGTESERVFRVVLAGKRETRWPRRGESCFCF